MPELTPRYAYINADDLPHLIRLNWQQYTLCRRMVVSVPEIQPANPAKVCPDCVRRAEHGARYVHADAALTVVCPVCGAEETPTPDMTLPCHQEQRRNKWGVYRTDANCGGAGRKPEANDA